MKNSAITLLVILVIILAAGGGYYLYKHATPMAPVTTIETPVATTTAETATTTPDGTAQVIGTSAGGRDIDAYHYGKGSDEILFVGGIHGGYEANTSLVAYNLMDYLAAHPEAISSNESVTVIPVMNPDGLAKVVGTSGRFQASDVPATLADTIPGRFNGNTVDLNRNFDCDWQAQGVWQSTTVSGGSAAFSEPETQAIKTYVQAHDPKAVVVWYSAAGGVYSSNCHDGVLPETAAITKIYADASGYPAHASFDFYATTGDMVNWLAKEKIPGISVLLTNHTDTEWDKNQEGVEALLKYYAK